MTPVRATHGRCFRQRLVWVGPREASSSQTGRTVRAWRPSLRRPWRHEPCALRRARSAAFPGQASGAAVTGSSRLRWCRLFAVAWLRERPAWLCWWRLLGCAVEAGPWMAGSRQASFGLAAFVGVRGVTSRVRCCRTGRRRSHRPGVWRGCDWFHAVVLVPAPVRHRSGLAGLSLASVVLRVRAAAGSVRGCVSTAVEVAWGPSRRSRLRGRNAPRPVPIFTDSPNSRRSAAFPQPGAGRGRDPVPCGGSQLRRRGGGVRGLCGCDLFRCCIRRGLWAGSAAAA
jgi:hypothetical protein